MAIANLKDLELKGKRVLTRVDFNVPLDDQQQITDDTRIQAALPTLKYILEQGGRLIAMSHLGRPKGSRVPEMSLKPAAARLGELLGKDIALAPDSVGPEVESMVNRLSDGEGILLENLRYYKEETDNEADFCSKLGALGDVYVNDAFGTAHRAHASTEGVCKLFAKRAPGFLMEKELDYLGKALQNPERPFVAILGGAKISGKIDVITALIPKVDALIIGGGLANTFLKAEGLEIGASLVEEEKIELAKNTLSLAAEHGKSLLIPKDVVIADAFDNQANRKTVSVFEVSGNWQILDIGPSTIEIYKEEILKARTIVWNGPMGVFEMDNFSDGTKSVAESIAEATKGGAVSVAGGGDSVAAIAKWDLRDNITHVSTGGGASLEFLEGKTLPGIAALQL